ncbi:MAG TPA: methyl-accepting chemotaxis protein [Anaerovoracaceae bacterium]|nr:methyl-accepting chemotaxis protein [Anaerovoracaceae bacterium]
MKLNLSRKIAVFAGILIMAASVALGVIAIKLSSDALMEQNKASMAQYVLESINHIDAELFGNLAALREAALRKDIASMEFETQRQSLASDITRLGYESMGVVKPNGQERNLMSGEIADLSGEEFIQKALSGEACTSGVLISMNTGQPAIIEAAPILLDNKVVGVLTGRRDANFISGITNELGIGARGFAFVMGPDSTIYAHPDKQKVLDQINIFEIDEAAAGGDLGARLKDLGLGVPGIIEYTENGESHIAAFAPIPNTDWTLGIGSYKADIMEDIINLRNIILLLSLIVAALGIGSAVILGNVISRPIRNLRSVADKLALGEVDVTVTSASEDEIGDLMKSFGKMIENIKTQSETAEKIAGGDLFVEIEPKSDKDVLAISLKSVIGNLRALVGETQRLTEAAAAGDLTTRGSEDSFHGGFREIVTGINSTLDGIVDPLTVALDFIQKVADGEDLEEIDNHYKGQYGILIGNLMMVRESLNLLRLETDNLTRAAFEGEFSYQPDVSLHKGCYAQIMRSVNEALVSIITPLRRSANYMNKIGRGEIPERITEEYKGEFDDIKESINACIEGLEGLAEGRDILVRMSENDYAKQVEGSYRGIYDEIASSVNAVSDTVRNIIRILDNIASGDLSDLQSLKISGRKNENDNLMPSVIAMIENIQFLIDEAAVLTEAAIQGRLDTQSDSAVFQGEWKNLVDGMNNILEEAAKPLRDVIEVMGEMSEGYLQITVHGSYRGDFDVLTRSISTLAAWLSGVVGEITEIIRQIADGNLALDRVRPYRGDYIDVSDSLNEILDSLNAVMGDINEAAVQVSAVARQVSDGSQALSRGSADQASSIEELTATISELADQTRQNAENATRASELAANAKHKAEKGNLQMTEMLKSMEEICESSVNISRIIKVIDDIAFQTNILALNAAVEAARAGQHGKGFSVVAEEVRTLASRSAEAARSTAELIEGSIHKVQGGTKIAQDSASALNEIAAEIEKAADLAENIAKASNEQASGIAQINKGIEQVARVVQNNSATAEESAAASEELTAQAEVLKEMVGKFILRQEAVELPGEFMLLDQSE